MDAVDPFRCDHLARIEEREAEEMGWPRLRNTLSGWHEGFGWGILPLVILSPLTGLLLALGVTLTPVSPAPPAAFGPPLTLIEAVRVLGRDHDLSGLTWIRPMGRNLVARLLEDGEMRSYTLTRDGGPAGRPGLAAPDS